MKWGASVGSNMACFIKSENNSAVKQLGVCGKVGVQDNMCSVPSAR